MIKFNPSGTPSTRILENKTPRVIFEDLALEKINYIVSNSPKEVGWLCSVEKQEPFYIIKDVYIFKQEVHATTTEITPEGLGVFAEELLAKENGVEIYNSIKAWGHSHVDMAVSPSAQDDSQMKVFEQGGNQFFIRMIANKKGELRVDVYDYESKLVFLCVNWETYLHYTTGLEEEIKKELAEKVTEKKYSTAYAGTSVYGRGVRQYWNGYDDYEEGTSWWMQNEKQKKAKINLNTITKIQDLFQLGIDEDEFYSIAELPPWNAMQRLIKIFKDYEIDTVVTLYNAERIQKLLIEYLKETYADIGGK